MPFQPGNQLYQLREKDQGTRPFMFEFPEELIREFNKYAKHKHENPERIHTPTASDPTLHTEKYLPLTMQGFAAFLGIARQTLTAWSKDGHHLADAVGRIKTVCEASQLEGAMIGKYNAPIVIRNLGLGDKVDHTSSDGSLKAPSKIELIAPKMDNDDSTD